MAVGSIERGALERVVLRESLVVVWMGCVVA